MFIKVTASTKCRKAEIRFLPGVFLKNGTDIGVFNEPILVTCLAIDRGVFASKFIVDTVMVELFFGWIPQNHLKISTRVIRVTRGARRLGV